MVFGGAGRGSWRHAMELIKRGLAHPILRNNSFIFMATMVVALAGYLLNTTAARRFAPGQYSQFGIMINLLGALAPLSSAIIGAVLRRASLNRAMEEREQTDAVQRTLFRHLAFTFLIGIAAITVSREQIGHFLRLTTTTPLYFVCIAGFWLAMQGVLQATMQEQGRYGKLSFVFFLEGVFRGVVGVTVIAVGLGISVTLGVYALSALFAALLMPWPRALWTGRGARRAIIQPLYRDVGELLVANLCFAVLINLDVILCRRYLAPVMADWYVALAALGKFFVFATNSVSAVAFAEVVKTVHRGESSRRPLAISLGLIVALGIPFVIFCRIFGPLVMAIAFGGTYRIGGHVLWLTALSAFAMSVINLEVAYFNARRWLWYLPVFLLGSVATITALSLAHQSLRWYAGIYATGTTTLALILLLPLFGILKREQVRENETPGATELPARENRLGLPGTGVLDG